MARSRSRGGDSGTKGDASVAGWTRLTWDDLTSWAGSRSVERGRTYQRGGRVTNLTISSDGELLATVTGTDRYATTVALSQKSKSAVLESACTCPVGLCCKHAVAVVAEYLQAIVDGRDVPLATRDDPRWAKLQGDSTEDIDDWDDDEDESWNDDEDFSPVRKTRIPRKPASKKAAGVNWNEKIQQHLRAKPQEELADLVWSLVQRFPEIYQEFRERIALQQGNVEELLLEARREIRRVTSEPAWQNHWDHEGHIPDYNPIRHRLERLLELGHADAVVSLGPDLLERGMQQVNESQDEGETANALGECLAILFQAVARSKLSRPDQLMFAIDAELADDYGISESETGVVLGAPATPEDWSVVADSLASRFKTVPRLNKTEGEDFSRNYQRDRVTGWIATALENADRDDELRPLYESEARITGSYERLVKYLIETKQFADAERWANEGIAATVAKLPGIATNLTESLCELARQRKQWNVVAAHVAIKFFSNYPSISAFDELMKAAKKAGVAEPVRAVALRFLETGDMPYHVISAKAPPAPPTRKKTSVKGRAISAPPSPVPEPDRVKIDPGWPLPIPDYLVPLIDRDGRYRVSPRPHLNVLLDMAINAKRPDEVLHWFDKMRAMTPQPGSYDAAPGHASKVAKAVTKTHPERAIEIYLTALKAQLPHAQTSAYEAVAGYLKLLRPLYETIGRSSDWTALLTSIREKYRNRPRFMELLDNLEGRTIVQTTRPQRK